MIVLSDLFKRIVQNLNTSFEDNGIDLSVRYSFGTYQETTKEIQDFGNSTTLKDQKFPLIWLVTEQDELFDSSAIGKPVLTNIQILIANSTDPNSNSVKRIDQNYIPVLYPIYEQLLIEIAASGFFEEQHRDDIYHMRTDRPFAGVKDQNGKYISNLFNSYVDVVHIRNMRLNVCREYCN